MEKLNKTICTLDNRVINIVKSRFIQKMLTDGFTKTEINDLFNMIKNCRLSVLDGVIKLNDLF